MTRSAAAAKSNPAPEPAVLLVDDNRDDQFFFQLAWEKSMACHLLRFASSCQQAMDYLNGQSEFADRIRFPFPALVVLDLQLPDRSGSQLLRWIRSQARFSRLLVIVLSGSVDEADVNQAYSNGANSFLQKSTRPQDLQQTVKWIQTYWLTQKFSAPGSRIQA